VVEVSEDDLKRYERIQPLLERVDNFLYMVLPGSILVGVVGVLLFSVLLLVFVDDRQPRLSGWFYVAMGGFGLSSGILVLTFLLSLLMRLLRFCFPALRRVDAARKHSRGRYSRRRRSTAHHHDR
jgi:uncharacterized membrane protein